MPCHAYATLCLIAADTLAMPIALCLALFSLLRHAAADTLRQLMPAICYVSERRATVTGTYDGKIRH